MGMMQQAVADGIRQGRFADRLVPRVDRELPRDQRRSALTPILDDLQEVTPLGVREGRQQLVVQGQQVDLREPRQQPTVGPIAAADGEVVQQPRRPKVDRGEAVSTRALDTG